jgi:hypothetical protein
MGAKMRERQLKPTEDKRQPHHNTSYSGIRTIVVILPVVCGTSFNRGLGR